MGTLLWIMLFMTLYLETNFNTGNILFHHQDFSALNQSLANNKCSRYSTPTVL